MEQKKTLWIALSAGIFLLVVFGTASLKYSSGAKRNVSAVALKDSNDILFSTDAIARKQPAEKGESQVFSIDPVPASSAAFSSGTYTPGASQDDGGVTTIDMLKNQGAGAEPVASASPVTAQNAAAEKAVKETQTIRKVEEKEKPKSGSGGGTATAKAAASSSSTATRTASAARSTPASSPGARYWVQVASFESKNNAEDARAELERHRLPCEVFTTTINGKLFYRVRVGAYTTKGDAESIKKQIGTIPMFKNGNSFITDAGAAAN